MEIKPDSKNERVSVTIDHERAKDVRQSWTDKNGIARGWSLPHTVHESTWIDADRIYDETIRDD